MKYFKISEEELNKLVNGTLSNEEDDEYHSAQFNSETGVLEIEGFYGVRDNTIQFEELKQGIININDCEFVVWHHCISNEHQEFCNIKFKSSMDNDKVLSFISGFCATCEDEMIRIGNKKKE